MTLKRYKYISFSARRGAGRTETSFGEIRIRSSLLNRFRACTRLGFLGRNRAQLSNSRDVSPSLNSS